MNSAKTYAEQLEDLAEQFLEETGATSYTLAELSDWAIDRGLWQPYPQDIRKILQNHFRKALGSIHREDPQGRRVRAHYAVPILKDNQMVFEWFKPENMNYEEMLACYQYRRNLAKNDVKQAFNDTTSWNENYSDGKLVEQDYDFNKDLLEDSTPDTHPDIDDDDDYAL
jgi:hypothetical protein